MDKKILNLYEQGCGAIDTAELLGVSTDYVLKVVRGGAMGNAVKRVVWCRTCSKPLTACKHAMSPREALRAANERATQFHAKK